VVSGRRAKADRRGARERVREEALERAEEGEARGCLICRRSDGGFTSSEHIFPESLGNSDLVLPNGVVCDRCNNEVLAPLDQTLCEFPPIMMRRTMLSVPSKAGKVPTTRVAQGSIENIGPGAIRLDSNNDATPMIREVGRSEDGVHLRFDWSGRRMTHRYGSELSRAILKIALECAWIDRGPDEALGHSFDHLRSAVLGEPRDGFVALGKDGDPEHFGLGATYQIVPLENGDVRVPIAAKFFGVIVMTDSRLVEAPPSFDPSRFDVIPFTPAHYRRR
jgi:hypothetical protein